MITTISHTYTTTECLENFIRDNLSKFQATKLLIQLFSISTDEEYIKEIQSLLNDYLPDAHIIGATTDGSISKNDSETTLISFTQFEKSSLKHTFTSFDLGAEDIAAQIICKDIISKKTKVLILFADGLLCNVEKLTREIHNQFPNVIMAGGLAGDNARLEKTLVCDNKELQSQAVVALAIESDSLYIHNDFNLAWEPIGLEMQITKAEGNIIYEIDGEKASLIFERHLDTKHLKQYGSSSAQPTITIEFPLIVKRKDMLVARTTMRINKDGSLFCAGEFQAGDTLSFGFTDINKITQSGIELSQRMLKTSVQTMFIYSCMARRRFMGENISHDIKPLYDIAPLSGFYSYGEIYTTQKKIEFLNYTMTILALSEEEEIYSYPVQKNININSHRAETLAALSKLIENSYNKKEDENLIQITDTLYYNKQSKTLLLNKEVVRLTKAEHKLFELFLSKKNSPIDTQTILAYVWEEQEKEISTNSVRTLVKKLRKKLPEKLIENSYGGYYRLVIKYYTT
jgi:hypothetical protein